MGTDRITEIKEQLKDDDLSSHKRDQLKRELNKLQSTAEGSAGVGLHRTVGIAVLAILLVAGIGYGLATAGIIQLSSPANTGGTVDPSNIAIDGEPTLGAEEAPVTVVLFEDFQCPVCKRFEDSVMPQLMSEYVESGQVKLVWKDFPLSQIHDWAQPSAEAMECVYRQDEDAFWTIKKQVFDNQGQLNAASAQTQIMDWAQDAGVSRSDVRACLNNDNPGAEVQADYGQGVNLGVSGTPSVFINGQMVPGLAPYSRYKQIIDQELANQ